jgi:hypothetical protein
MVPSLASRICVATLLVWWSFTVLHEPWSAAQVQEVTKPAPANAEAESQAGEIDVGKKLAAEGMVTVTEKQAIQRQAKGQEPAEGTDHRAEGC